MCEIRPPVTLWGTTQIKTFTTILSTGALNQVSTITKETIVTNVIPVQTRSYPCTSNTPSPSSNPTPTPSPPPEPQPQPQSQPQASSEIEITTSRAPVSSPSPSTESSRVSGGETDSLTVELSPSRTLSTTTTTRGTSSSIVLQTVEPTPTPTDDPISTDTDPVLSASSLFTDADHPDSTAGAALASSSSSQTVLPIGAIVGIILAALLVLSLIGFFLWTRKHKKDRDSEGDGDPYWERRFQQLESVQSQSKPRLDTVPSPDDDEGTWRRHVSHS
jgi:cobalamin biosynthesis Mg chelatase CobN